MRLEPASQHRRPVGSRDATAFGGISTPPHTVRVRGVLYCDYLVDGQLVASYDPLGTLEFRDGQRFRLDAHPAPVRDARLGTRLYGCSPSHQNVVISDTDRHAEWAIPAYAELPMDQTNAWTIHCRERTFQARVFNRILWRRTKLWEGVSKTGSLVSSLVMPMLAIGRFNADLSQKELVFLAILSDAF